MTDTDPLTRQIAELAPISDEGFAALAHPGARDQLLAEIVRTPTGPEARHRRLRVPVIAAAGAATVVAGAAAGWALVRSGATDTVSLQCQINGTDAIIPASSGDPVADCAAEWQRETGTAAPRLTAYDNGHGGITVAAAGQPPAPSAVPLPPGVTQNVTAITLQETLDDYVNGLKSSCRSADAAATFVRQALDAAGLTGWSVSAPPGGADGTTTCADTAIVDATARTVLLRALTGPKSPDLPFVRLAARLRQLTGCTSADALAGQVRTLAAESGLSEAAHEYRLTTVTSTAHCAVVHETVGGTVFLTVRGPRG